MTSESPGGAEFAAVNMLDALAAHGHQTVLVTNQPQIAEGRTIDVRTIDLGPKLSRSSVGHLFLRSPRLLSVLRDALQRESPYDVLVLHFKKEQLLGSLLPKRLRPRLVWAEWGPVPQQMSRGPGRWAFVAAARRTDLIFAVSPGTRESLERAGIPGDCIHIVPNALPVDTAKFSSAGPGADPRSVRYSR